jgi:pimeloyl-ACP methyl ester carboxylesterase
MRPAIFGAARRPAEPRSSLSVLARAASVVTIGAVLAGAVAVTPGIAGAAQQAGRPPAVATAAQAAASDRTSAAEKKRVDRVKVKLDWYACYEYAECASMRVPLDYDQPAGAKTEVAVLRVKARNPERRIGSLFVNPGGPGGAATTMALDAPNFLSDEVLDRFDIVGVDPRGIGASDNIRCFKSHRDQVKATAGMNVAFPWTKAEEKAWIASATAIGKACSTTGRSIGGAMSTAEVARDMDVARRAVGDPKLSFLGFSYGSALGQYYANMFPDRLRAVAIDGVVNPASWVGSPKRPDAELDERLRSANGAYKALRELLARCAKVDAKLCPFADGTDLLRKFDTVAERLRAKPAAVDDGEGGVDTITYADFIGTVLGSLYMRFGPLDIVIIVGLAQELYTATNPAATSDQRAAAGAALTARLRTARDRAGRDFRYENDLEAFLGVACTDGLHPRSAAQWPALAAKADKRAPYFGRAWAWPTSPCARATWTARDEDAYRGPFNRRTSAPVLVVGNYWDPATNYDDAVGAARLLPNSRLLSSDNWGHTAYGTSVCATTAIDSYLLRGTLPAKGKVCVGEMQPFVEPDADTRRAARMQRPEFTNKADVAAQGAPAEGEPKHLPPVIARTPMTGPAAGR